MRMPSRREWVLLLLLPPLVWLALAEPEGDSAPRAAAESKADAAAKPDAAARKDQRQLAQLDLGSVARSVEKDEPANLFASKSWYVPPPPPPPPPPPKPVPPPPPTAPPLPFTYLGRFVEAGKPVIFLVRGDRVLTVKVGDVVEGNYRVEGIVGSTLSLTYLPLNIKQTLDIGAAG
jgi:hypothetical protein